MKQPQDTKTLELELDGKRGRGRPRKPDALTQAERAKRYRDNKRMNKSDAGSVTQAKEWPWPETHREAELEKRIHELAAQLRQAHQTIDGLRKEQELLIQERTNAFKAYDDMCIQWEQAHADKATIVEQAAANGNRAYQLEQKLARRDKTIKQLRDELKRHA